MSGVAPSGDHRFLPIERVAFGPGSLAALGRPPAGVFTEARQHVPRTWVSAAAAAAEATGDRLQLLESVF